MRQRQADGLPLPTILLLVGVAAVPAGAALFYMGLFS
jgi:hypothetical protein